MLDPVSTRPAGLKTQWADPLMSQVRGESGHLPLAGSRCRRSRIDYMMVL